VKLAIGILVLGLACLVALLLPSADAPDQTSWLVAMWETRRPIDSILLALGAGLPIVMGVWGIVREPLRWHGAVATAGFALVFVKFRMWEAIKRFTEAEVSGQLLMAATIAGMLISFVALATREA
jgi:hypothetical protein